MVVHGEGDVLGRAGVLIDEALEGLVKLVDEALLALEGVLDERVVLVLQVEEVSHVLEVVDLGLLTVRVRPGPHDLPALDHDVLRHPVLNQVQPRQLPWARGLVDAREEVKHAPEVIDLAVLQQPHQARPLLLYQRLHVPPDQLMLHHLLDPPLPRVVVDRQTRAHAVLLLLQPPLHLLQVFGASIGVDEVLALDPVELLRALEEQHLKVVVEDVPAHLHEHLRGILDEVAVHLVAVPLLLNLGQQQGDQPRLNPWRTHAVLAEEVHAHVVDGLLCVLLDKGAVHVHEDVAHHPQAALVVLPLPFQPIEERHVRLRLDLGAQLLRPLLEQVLNVLVEPVTVLVEHHVVARTVELLKAQLPGLFVEYFEDRAFQLVP
mmetsp:Transcript_5212/g.13243  ORF Transcript_5212/g.13243 Transcript_5212/m.13243 type:complete len:376 (-) Transcript_5212:175-1302(-)